MEAKNIVSILQNIYNESIGFRRDSGNNSSYIKNVDSTPASFVSTDYLETGGSRGSVSGTSRPELKNLVFKLKNYFFVDAFSEEFISYDGIRVLINLIDNTSGNTRVILKDLLLKYRIIFFIILLLCNYLRSFIPKIFLNLNL